MPIQIDNEIYLTQQEARDLLGGISDHTLRKIARENGVQRFNRSFAPNIKYYKKSDIEKLVQMRPVEEDEEEKKEESK